MIRVFLVSPVRLDGVRGNVLREGRGPKQLAARLQSIDGAPIADVFSYVSGLYFRGKVSYARRFARPPTDVRWLGSGALVITHNRGLAPAESRIVHAHLESFADTPIAADEPGFAGPLERDAERLRDALGADGQAVLLGSLATPKYLVPLTRALGDRLFVPHTLLGRGDMARGAILLAASRSGDELPYRAQAPARAQGHEPGEQDEKSGPAKRRRKTSQPP